MRATQWQPLTTAMGKLYPRTTWTRTAARLGINVPPPTGGGWWMPGKAPRPVKLGRLVRREIRVLEEWESTGCPRIATPKGASMLSNSQPEAAKPTLLLSPNQAAEALAISPRKLWDMTASGEVPSIRIGRSVRYSVDDLRQWIDDQRGGGR